MSEHRSLPAAAQQALDLALPGAPRRVLCHGVRGAGKTWWLDTVGAAAAASGFRVARCGGSVSQSDLALSGLATLVGPLSAGLDDVGHDAEVLRRVLRGDGVAEPAAVKLATLRVLTAAADRAPLCLVVDDAHLLDSSSRDVLDAVLPRCAADPIVLFAAATDTTCMEADAVVRLEPLPERVVVTVLTDRGLAPAAAARCAAAAAGNPGVAVAMAEALSDAQRAGEAPVPDLPKVGGQLAAELQARMRALGESCCRALVVAAAADGGDLGAVAGALAVLGEPGIEALEPAEEAGVVEIVGAKVTFPDPFVRHAAFHLLAPASRRAAHRALAASFTQPHQAGARVWHLVGAANGPSDALADALALVAADAERRGAIATAVRTYERAIEFAATVATRERAVVAAIGAALIAGDVHHAGRLADSIASTSDDAREARAEVNELRTGAVNLAVAARPGGSLAVRREAAAAAHAGRHRDVLRLLGEQPRHQLDVVPVAVALRHAGRVRQAREVLAAGDPSTGWDGTALHRWWLIENAALDVLAGRRPDEWLLSLPTSVPEPLPALASAVIARSRLADDPTTSPTDHPLAWPAVGDGPLADVHQAMRDALLQGTADGWAAAVSVAEHHRLPVEAGEARLWQADALWRAGNPAAADTARLALATLQRCGVRAWDTRAAAIVAPASAPVAARPTDPALEALSQAERRVVDAVAEGMTNREAAAALFLSVKTVDFHLQQIYRKLGVRSRTELAIRVAGAAPSVSGLPADGGGQR